MNAEIVYLYAFDIAQEADLSRIKDMLTGLAEPFDLGRLKDAPRTFPMYRPLSIRLEPMQLKSPSTAIEVFASMKIFAIGAMTIKLRVPITLERLSDFAAYRDLRLADGTSLDDRVREIARITVERIASALDTPTTELQPPEAYTVFCAETPPGAAAGADAEQWLRANEREVAALLVNEPDPLRLSAQEVTDTIRTAYSYYKRDLAVLDWDAALLIDTPAEYNDTLYVMEVANLQLEELRVYDAILDRALDKAYDDVERASRPFSFFERRRVINDLRNIHMDLTKVSDQISNITKFFGDWHLARVYMGCASRFHLSEWENMVNSKLKALDDLYSMLQQDSANQALILLDTAIVGLFILDLIIIIVIGAK